MNERLLFQAKQPKKYCGKGIPSLLWKTQKKNTLKTYKTLNNNGEARRNNFICETTTIIRNNINNGNLFILLYYTTTYIIMYKTVSFDDG
jgi:hypothetical protein